MAEEAAGRSPALSFPVWVAGTRRLHQEAQRYPCAGHPARASAPAAAGLPADERACAVRTAQPWRAKGVPCCGAEPAGSTEISGCPRRAYGTTTVAEPTRGHGAPRFDARSVDFAFSLLGAFKCVFLTELPRGCSARPCRAPSARRDLPCVSAGHRPPGHGTNQ